MLERIAAGDSEAVRECLAKYGDLVWSLARSFTGNDADAEDAVQDIFILLWERADRFDRHAGSEVTFVSVLARRRLIDRWRRASRQPRAAELDPEARTGDLPPALDEDLAAAREALATLSADEREVLELSVCRGRSHQQIAESTGLPLGTVKTRVRRALARVRECVSGAQERTA